MQDKLKPKHTPGKWHESLGRVCDDRLNGEIAQCSPRGSDACAVMQANARRIVQCVNAHDALVEALEEIAHNPPWGTPHNLPCSKVRTIALAALAAAKVQP